MEHPFFCSPCFERWVPPQQICPQPSTPRRWSDDQRWRVDTATSPSEELASATWRRRLEELDSFDPVETLTASVPTQRHIPKSFQWPFRSILMDMLSLINKAQQTGDWKTSERAEKLFLLLLGGVRAPPPPEPQEQPSRHARSKEAYTMQLFPRFPRGESSRRTNEDAFFHTRRHRQGRPPTASEHYLIRRCSHDRSHSEHGHGDAQTPRRPATQRFRSSDKGSGMDSHLARSHAPPPNDGLGKSERCSGVGPRTLVRRIGPP